MPRERAVLDSIALRKHDTVIISDCVNKIPSLRDLSKISRGSGVETEGESQLFETAEKGGVMKNGPLKGGGPCKYVSVIM